MTLPRYIQDYLSDTGIQELDECIAFSCPDGSGTLLFQRFTHEVLVTTMPLSDDLEHG